MSVLSQQKVGNWQDSLSVEETNLLLMGAARASNDHQRLKFEPGNWKGQKMLNEDKFYDQVYNRYYEPDKVKEIKYKHQEPRFQTQMPYNLTGERKPHVSEVFKNLCRSRAKNIENNPPMKFSTMSSI